MQGLIRTLKSKDQHIQESTVKIELLERKMENVKKQADAIVDLEDELGKARKQERAYEEAMEQLQMDLDQLEQDNEGLRLATAGQERQGRSRHPGKSSLVQHVNVNTRFFLPPSFLPSFLLSFSCRSSTTGNGKCRGRRDVRNFVPARAD